MNAHVVRYEFVNGFTWVVVPSVWTVYQRSKSTIGSSTCSTELNYIRIKFKSVEIDRDCLKHSTWWYGGGNCSLKWRQFFEKLFFMAIFYFFSQLFFKNLLPKKCFLIFRLVGNAWPDASRLKSQHTTYQTTATLRAGF